MASSGSSFDYALDELGRRLSAKGRDLLVIHGVPWEPSALRWQPREVRNCQVAHAAPVMPKLMIHRPVSQRSMHFVDAGSDDEDRDID